MIDITTPPPDRLRSDRFLYVYFANGDFWVSDWQGHLCRCDLDGLQTALIAHRRYTDPATRGRPDGTAPLSLREALFPTEITKRLRLLRERDTAHAAVFQPRPRPAATKLSLEDLGL